MGARFDLGWFLVVHFRFHVICSIYLYTWLDTWLDTWFKNFVLQLFKRHAHAETLKRQGKAIKVHAQCAYMCGHWTNTLIWAPKWPVTSHQTKITLHLRAWRLR